MSEDVRGDSGLIGPNAILQMLPVIAMIGGQDRVDAMMARAGLFAVPDGLSMIPEADAARLHRQLRLEEPELAPHLAAEAGFRTADYIMAHRIPGPAQTLLKALPPALAARALSRAIARHAWTFAGTGYFRVVSPWAFEIVDNPIIRGESSAHPLCAWHAAVFEGLYTTLVSPTARCVETACGAQPGKTACRFEITR